MASWIRKIRPVVVSWSLSVLLALLTVATALANDDKGNWP